MKAKTVNKVNKRLIGVAATVAVGTVLYACGGDSGSGPGSAAVSVNQGTVLLNANVVSTQDGSVSQGMSIIIDGGKIQQILPATSGVNVGGSAKAIDATGKYVVPGFMDMHSHAFNSVANAPGDFPVLLANGVTGVREAGGSPALIQLAKQQNAAVAAGTADAPEVVMMPSTIYSGQGPTDATARQFVRDRKAEGADFIKASTGPREGFLAMMDEAKKQGFHAAGHLTNAVSALESSNGGYHSFEHLGSSIGLLIDCASDEANIRAAVLANPRPPAPNVVNPRLYDGNEYRDYYQRILDTYSDAKCQSLAQAFVKNDTWQAVTLIRLRTQDYGDDPAYVNDPNLKYVDKARVALWQSIGQQFSATITPAARATLQSYYARQLQVVKMMKQNGVKIMAGSDLGGGWLVPGFSLHQEFKQLAAAGLSPLEVLQATTLNGAQFANRTSTLGSVEAGKNADLVLLDANPIADVANLDKVSSVLLRGKYYSRAALDKLLSDAATAYANQSLKVAATIAASVEPEPPHSD